MLITFMVLGGNVCDENISNTMHDDINMGDKSALTLF